MSHPWGPGARRPHPPRAPSPPSGDRTSRPVRSKVPRGGPHQSRGIRPWAPPVVRSCVSCLGVSPPLESRPGELIRPRLRQTRSHGPRSTGTRPGARDSAPSSPSRLGTAVRTRASPRRSGHVAAGTARPTTASIPSTSTTCPRCSPASWFGSRRRGRGKQQSCPVRTSPGVDVGARSTHGPSSRRTPTPPGLPSLRGIGGPSVATGSRGRATLPLFRRTRRPRGVRVGGTSISV